MTFGFGVLGLWRVEMECQRLLVWSPGLLEFYLQDAMTLGLESWVFGCGNGVPEAFGVELLASANVLERQ